MGLSGHFKHLVLFVATIDNCLFYCINFLLLATCLAFFCHENLFVSRAKNRKFHAVPVAILADWNHFSFNSQKSFPLKSNKKLTNHLKKLQYTIYKLKSNKFNLLLNVRHIIPKKYKNTKKNYWRFFEDIFHL